MRHSVIFLEAMDYCKVILLEALQLVCFDWRINMVYGQQNDESIITEYLDSHLEYGIKQKNLDKILDIIDDYIELKEEFDNE